MYASEPGELHNELVRRTVDSRVTRMSSWRSITRIVDRYADAYRLLGDARQKGIRIVHAHDVWRAEYAHFIARRLAIPYVVHVRGPLTPRDIKKHKLNSADALIAIARRYVDDLVKSGIDPRRIALVDDGVNLDLFSPSHADPTYLARNFGLKDRLLVGIVGRLSAFKHIDDFLNIVSRMPPAMEQAVMFVIAGKWDNAEYRDQISETVRRLGIASRVAIVGRIPIPTRRNCCPVSTCSLRFLAAPSCSKRWPCANRCYRFDPTAATPSTPGTGRLLGALTATALTPPRRS